LFNSCTSSQRPHFCRKMRHVKAKLQLVPPTITRTNRPITRLLLSRNILLQRLSIHAAREWTALFTNLHPTAYILLFAATQHYPIINRSQQTTQKTLWGSW
jgi:hypothetical protein